MPNVLFRCRSLDVALREKYLEKPGRQSELEMRFMTFLPDISSEFGGKHEAGRRVLIRIPSSHK